jgi:hypothetical protein
MLPVLQHHERHVWCLECACVSNFFPIVPFFVCSEAFTMTVGASIVTIEVQAAEGAGDKGVWCDVQLWEGF